MIPIDAELDNLIKPAPLREDEYLGEDSLIYCSKCCTARFSSVMLFLLKPDVPHGRFCGPPRGCPPLW